MVREIPRQVEFPTGCTGPAREKREAVQVSHMKNSHSAALLEYARFSRASHCRGPPVPEARTATLGAGAHVGARLLPPLDRAPQQTGARALLHARSRGHLVGSREEAKWPP